MLKFIVPALTIFALALPAAAQIETTVEELVSTGEDSLSSGADRPAEISGNVRALPIALLFTGMDINRDKRVTRNEVITEIPREWQSLKPSFTNKVSAFKLIEWSKSALGSEDALPSRLSFDRNLDNQVSAEEFSERLLADFDRMDENGDGVLTREELIFVAAPRIIREDRHRPSRAERMQRQERGQRRAF